MKLLAPLFLGLSLICLALSGCSGPQPSGITVTLVNFKPIDASLLESRATLTLRYTNESIAPFGLSGSRHKLYLNNTFVGTAVSDQPIGVPPLQTATQDVVVNLENLALVRQVLAVRESQTIAYRLDSVLLQTIDEEKYQTKTHTSGALDLRALSGAVQP